MKTKFISHAIVSFLFVCLSVSSQAEDKRFQSMIELVPEDALLYYYTAGQNAPGYQGSDDQKLFGKFDMMKMYRSILPLIKKNMPEGEHQELESLMKLNEAMYLKPGAFYFRIANAMPEITYIAKTKDVAKYALPFGDIDEMKVVTEGEYTIFHNQQNFQLKPEKSVTQSASFKKILAGASYQPTYLYAANLDHAIKVFEQHMVKDMGRNDRKQWEMAKAIIGISQLESISMIGGYENTQWRWSNQLSWKNDKPKEITGTLLDLMQSEPLDMNWINTIPNDSSSIGAFRLDLMAIFNKVKEILGKTEPKALESLTQGLNMARGFGIDVEKDVLGALGGQWSFYQAESVGGDNLTGLVFQNKLRHPAKLKGALGTMIRMSEMAANAAMQAQDIPVQIDFKSFDYAIGENKVQINYFAMPFLAPCWAIHEDTLLFAFQKQTLAAALHHKLSAAKGSTLKDNPSFVKLKKQLTAGKPLCAFFYTDNSNKASGRYQVLLSALQIFSGGAEMLGTDLPPMPLPIYAEAKPILSKPTTCFLWQENGQIRYESQSAFPFSGMLPESYLSLSSYGLLVPMQAAIMLPALGRARRTALSAASGSNLSAIGRGMAIKASTE